VRERNQMNEVNNNPVVHLDVWVTSHLQVGAHNPFPNGDQEVLDALMSGNGVWPISVEPCRMYRYETERLFRVELWWNEYKMLLENNMMGWSQFTMRISEPIKITDNPSSVDRDTRRCGIEVVQPQLPVTAGSK
jgi:hypothetical protein